MPKMPKMYETLNRMHLKKKNPKMFNVHVMEKKHSRNSSSPKHHEQFMKNKQNYPLEYKPNINDLRQLFDDNTRQENKRNHRHSAIYGDAKHTTLDENVFEYKIGQHHQSQSVVTAAIPSTRHPNFERVKQKFDRPNISNSPSSSTRNGKKTRNFSSFLKFNSKRSDSIQSTPNDNSCDVATKISNTNPNPNNTNSNLTESIDSIDSTKAIAGDASLNKQIDAYMNNSLNIDGFKVSEDDSDGDQSHSMSNL